MKVKGKKVSGASSVLPCRPSRNRDHSDGDVNEEDDDHCRFGWFDAGLT